MKRREFLKSLGSGILTVGATNLPLTYLTGCTKAYIPKKYKKGILPSNPVAMIWNSTVRSYPNIEISQSNENNPVKDMVIETLSLLSSLNKNPLSEIIRQGDKVVIKPNFMTDKYFPIPITNPSVLWPVIDLACQLKPSTVSIVEAPQYSSTMPLFTKKYTDMEGTVEYYRKKYPDVKVECLNTNFTPFTWVMLGKYSEHYNAYDPSELFTCDKFKPCISNYFFDAVDSRGINPGEFLPGIYAIPNIYLESDVFINMPKLKTHGQTGITCAVKNLMGMTRSSTLEFANKQNYEIIYSKNLERFKEAKNRDVPHYGGRPLKFFRGEATKEKDLLMGPENDVLWRTLADLNKIIFYADKNGEIKLERQRKYIAIVDGIIGMEGNGPATKEKKFTGTIIAGFDPLMVDAACCRVMGWDNSVINTIVKSAEIKNLPIGQLDELKNGLVGEQYESPAFGQYFKPHKRFSPPVFDDIRIKI